MLNRFKKKVVMFGNSRVVKTPEFQLGDEVIVLSKDEIDFIKNNY